MSTRRFVTLLTVVSCLGAFSCSSDGGDAGSGTGGQAGSAADAGAGGSTADDGGGGATEDTGGGDSAVEEDAGEEATVEGSAGACLDGIAWYSDNSTGSATDPGLKTPNAFGLYDMLGNAAEWVQDCYHETYADGPTDGTAWEEDSCEYRVIRGGCYGTTARGTRVSWRDGVKPTFYGACAPGVRCVRTSSTTPPTALIEMEWVPIPAGTFSMGCSTADDQCFDNETPTRTVSVGAFEMTAKEPTQQEYFDQMGDSPATPFCGACAETYVSWDDAIAFCEALGGRLPTEAEWEYAARGGTTTRYYCGDE